MEVVTKSGKDVWADTIDNRTAESDSAWTRCFLADSDSVGQMLPSLPSPITKKIFFGDKQQLITDQHL